MTTEAMPPVPRHPSHYEAWSASELKAIEAYGQLVAQECARICEQGAQATLHAPLQFDNCTFELAEPSANLAIAIRKRFNLETST